MKNNKENGAVGEETVRGGEQKGREKNRRLCVVETLQHVHRAFETPLEL